MAHPTTARNVLTALDDHKPTAFYWQLTLLATLGGFLFGYDTSNIGSALNFVPYPLHGLSEGYLASGASLGAAAGAILGGPAADRFGRKTLLIVDAGIFAALCVAAIAFIFWFLPEPRACPSRRSSASSNGSGERCSQSAPSRSEPRPKPAGDWLIRSPAGTRSGRRSPR